MLDSGANSPASVPTPDEPPERGRTADSPWTLPWQGWKDVLRRVVREVREDRLDIIAGGVAFYALLAIGPALAALVSIYGMFASPKDLEELIGTVAALTPDASRGLLLDEMLAPAIAAAPQALTLGAVLGVMLSLWSANRGMKALMAAVSVAYEEPRSRGFVRQNLLSLGLLSGAVIMFALVAVAVIAFPHLLQSTELGERVASLLTVMRWPLLFALFLFSLAALYRWAPVRRSPKWRWVTVGSLAATLLWLGFCGLFSIYSRHFLELRGYGAITGVVALALWLFGSAYAILLGAELNAEIEHQTARDSTTGEPRPLGLRGAYVAGHIGK
ncbi:MAG TPA: YihY/virulence factor BrkB family protein, partial [Enhygromyxa sp.]|nr:YihY/virulence factor BrkB family protein [Enhygromyxa sp.]